MRYQMQVRDLWFLLDEHGWVLKSRPRPWPGVKVWEGKAAA